eukprot:TRINITY_DN7720_c0_g1_i1.p1 TRINITY_DN7720_c0_g1~~TRINITY_DN7720_c0_g1_i1.p1  ORF type:complete len:202 (+),score=25.78 TRINITY_DN7720_c0_g1_i1:124-729(+)
MNNGKLQSILSSKPVDVNALRALSCFGFADDRTRRQVWPFLLGMSEDEVKEVDESALDASQIVFHPYFEQVGKDIDRSLFHFDIAKKMNKQAREEARKQLERIIHTIFSLHPDLHYVQGYHDICSVLYLVCGEHLGFHLAERLSLLHIRDSLRSNLDTVVQLLNLLFPLLSLADPQLHKFMRDSEIQPFFFDCLGAHLVVA